MKIIQIKESRFKELFDITCLELSENKCLNEHNHYNSDSEYQVALREMYRRFIYHVRTLQGKLKDS